MAAERATLGKTLPQVDILKKMPLKQWIVRYWCKGITLADNKYNADVLEQTLASFGITTCTELHDHDEMFFLTTSGLV